MVLIQLEVDGHSLNMELDLLTIYAPIIYTAPCTSMTWEVGGGWALEFPSFLGPVKWERADRRVTFGPSEMGTSR